MLDNWDEWNDFAFPKLVEFAKNDKIYSDTLEEYQAAEDIYSQRHKCRDYNI